MALDSSFQLDAMGLPSMALEALQVTRKILLPGASPSSSSSQQGKAVAVAGGMGTGTGTGAGGQYNLLHEQYNRLLTACWAPTATATACSGKPLPHSHPACTPPWREVVEQRLVLLCTAGMPCSPTSVLAALEQHARCTAPADAQPLLPPPRERMADVSAAAVVATAVSPPTTTGPVPLSSPFGSPTGRSIAAAVAAQQQRSATSPRHPAATSMSPRGSMERSPRHSAGSVGGGHSPASLSGGGGGGGPPRETPSRSSSGLSMTSSSCALLPHHPHQAAYCLFEEPPLEVVNIEGDKCRSAASSGLVTPDGHGRPFAVVTGARKGAAGSGVGRGAQ